MIFMVGLLFLLFGLLPLLSRQLSQLIQQIPDTAEALTDIICDSADLLAFFTGTGGLRKTLATKAAINPNKFVWVVVGDRKKIEPGLRELGLGEPRAIDADGNPVK